MAPASRIRALDRFFFLRWLLSIIAFVLTTNDCCGYYDGHKSRSRSEDDILSHRHDGMSSRGPPARPAAGPFLEMEPDPVKAVDTKNRQDAVAYSDEIDICLLMIVRDEETSLRTNLPLWRDVATCYVIGVDDRTTDSTVEVILEVLPNDQPRFVFFFMFEDFAQARNEVLRSTTHHFPDASHVLFADADWRLDLATVDLSEVDHIHASFQFLVWDHSGDTTRYMGWLLRNDRRLRFKYRIHETLDITAVSAEPAKAIDWEIHVVEGESSWHAEQHGHSRAAQRFAFDLQLLELDYRDDPSDERTLFYLGITTYSYMEALIGKGTHETTPETAALIKDGMFYFRRIIDLYGIQPGNQFVWGALRWLAYGYQYFSLDVPEAERWYRECIAYDSTRVDCTVSMSRLFLDHGYIDAAWELAKKGLLHRSHAKHTLDYFTMYECFVPIQAAMVISKRVDAKRLGDDSLDATLTLGSFLMRHHAHHCTHRVLVDTAEDIRELELWFDSAADRAGADVEDIQRAVLLGEGASMLKVLLQTWGTGQMASAYSSQIAPPADADVSDTAAKSDDDDANKVDRRDAQTQARHDVHQLEAEEWCAQIVYDVTALMKHQNNSSDDERARAARLHATSGVIAATDMSQIIADEPLTSFPASREGGQVMDVFRALIIGSVGGLNDETLAHVVSMMVQLSAAPFPFEITYLNPDGPTLAAARALVADGCSDELIRGTHDTLRFVEATLVDFLDTADTDGENVQKFDYVDVGGPLASPPSEDSDQEDSSMNIDTLLLLGEKLLKRGAYLRVWSFAASPEGNLLFRARDAYAATSSMPESAAGDPRNLSRRILAHQTSAEVTLAQVLRNRFGLGWEQTDGNDSDESLANEQNGSRTMTASGGETVGQQKTVIPTTAAQRRAAQDEQTWVKQVLTARRDERMLTVSDIDAVLSRAGFKTTQLLGDVKRYERGGAGDEGWNFSGVDDILEGMSRWEAAALADSLAPQPVLVHQVLAVWQDDLDSL